jgi:hypothetical protein
MRRFLLIAAIVCLSAPAWAQANKKVVSTCGGVTMTVGEYTPGTVNTSGQDCVSAAGGATPGTVIVTNPGIVGFGNLALTNASTLLSTATVGPNSGVWPTTPAIVDVTNDRASAGVAYVCPLGGTCTSANGVPVAVGQSFRFTKPATTMTMISASTSTIEVQF